MLRIWYSMHDYASPCINVHETHPLIVLSYTVELYASESPNKLNLVRTK